MGCRVLVVTLPWIGNSKLNLQSSAKFSVASELLSQSNSRLYWGSILGKTIPPLVPSPLIKVAVELHRAFMEIWEFKILIYWKDTTPQVRDFMLEIAVQTFMSIAVSCLNAGWHLSKTCLVLCFPTCWHWFLDNICYVFPFPFIIFIIYNPVSNFLRSKSDFQCKKIALTYVRTLSQFISNNAHPHFYINLIDLTFDFLPRLPNSILNLRHKISL